MGSAEIGMLDWLLGDNSRTMLMVDSEGDPVSAMSRHEQDNLSPLKQGGKKTWWWLWALIGGGLFLAGLTALLIYLCVAGGAGKAVGDKGQDGTVVGPSMVAVPVKKWGPDCGVYVELPWERQCGEEGRDPSIGRIFEFVPKPRREKRLAEIRAEWEEKKKKGRENDNGMDNNEQNGKDKKSQQPLNLPASFLQKLRRRRLVAQEEKNEKVEDHDHESEVAESGCERFFDKDSNRPLLVTAPCDCEYSDWDVSADSCSAADDDGSPLKYLRGVRREPGHKWRWHHDVDHHGVAGGESTSDSESSLAAAENLSAQQNVQGWMQYVDVEEQFLYNTDEVMTARVRELHEQEQGEGHEGEGQDAAKDDNNKTINKNSYAAYNDVLRQYLREIRWFSENQGEGEGQVDHHGVPESQQFVTIAPEPQPLYEFGMNSAVVGRVKAAAKKIVDVKMVGETNGGVAPAWTDADALALQKAIEQDPEVIQAIEVEARKADIMEKGRRVDIIKEKGVMENDDRIPNEEESPWSAADFLETALLPLISDANARKEVVASQPFPLRGGSCSAVGVKSPALVFDKRGIVCVHCRYKKEQQSQPQQPPQQQSFLSFLRVKRIRHNLSEKTTSSAPVPVTSSSSTAIENSNIAVQHYFPMPLLNKLSVEQQTNLPGVCAAAAAPQLCYVEVGACEEDLTGNLKAKAVAASAEGKQDGVRTMTHRRILSGEDNTGGAGGSASSASLTLPPGVNQDAEESCDLHFAGNEESGKMDRPTSVVTYELCELAPGPAPPGKDEDSGDTGVDPPPPDPPKDPTQPKDPTPPKKTLKCTTKIPRPSDDGGIPKALVAVRELVGAGALKESFEETELIGSGGNGIDGGLIGKPLDEWIVTPSGEDGKQVQVLEIPCGGENSSGGPGGAKSSRNPKKKVTLHFTCEKKEGSPANVPRSSFLRLLKKVRASPRQELHEEGEWTVTKVEGNCKGDPAPKTLTCENILWADEIPRASTYAHVKEPLRQVEELVKKTAESDSSRGPQVKIDFEKSELMADKVGIKDFTVGTPPTDWEVKLVPGDHNKATLQIPCGGGESNRSGDDDGSNASPRDPKKKVTLHFTCEKKGSIPSSFLMLVKTARAIEKGAWTLTQVSGNCNKESLPLIL